MNVKIVRWIVLLMLAALLLAACTPTPAATDEAEPTAEAEATEEAPDEATEEATEEPVATGEATAEATEVAEAATGEPLRIGVIQDLSGGLLLFGNEALNGFNLGIEYASGGDMIVAGRPIEILVRDDAGNAENAAAAARELIEAEGVEILFGTSSSANALQIQQIAAENDVLYFAGPAAAPD
jgi:branched-chain amino acid transport system substrate-binding protein